MADRRHLRLLLSLLCAWCAHAQNNPAKTTLQKPDNVYTNLVKQYLSDPRISTELVDHMPASDTVPSPLSFFARIPGTPGELTYAKDIHRYFDALAANSPRARFGPSAKPKKAATKSSSPSLMKPLCAASTITKPCSRPSPTRARLRKKRRGA